MVWLGLVTSVAFIGLLLKKSSACARAYQLDLMAYGPVSNS